MSTATDTLTYTVSKPDDLDGSTFTDSVKQFRPSNSGKSSVVDVIPGKGIGFKPNGWSGRNWTAVLHIEEATYDAVMTQVEAIEALAHTWGTLSVTQNGRVRAFSSMALLEVRQPDQIYEKHTELTLEFLQTSG